jgi:hypothetical protein
MSRGETGWAFALSSLPVVLSLAAIGAWVAGNRPQRQRDREPRRFFEQLFRQFPRLCDVYLP